MRKEVLQ
ncbi:hypothetical protein CFP56_015947 [Quercus suber]